MRTHYILTMVLALGGSLALAQNNPRQQDPSSMPPSQQQPTTDQGTKGASSSTGVQGDIQSALQKEPTLASSNISVQVSGNTVELTGTVANQSDKDTAEQIAKAHAGGMDVKNNLKVSGPGSK